MRNILHHRFENLLDKKSKNELTALAKELNMSGYSKLSKQELVEQILSFDKKKLKGILFDSWWKKYHNHIYGIASIIGLFIAIITLMPKGEKEKKNDFEQLKTPVYGGVIRIGGKHFLESSILLEIIAITLEEKSNPKITVNRRHNFSETMYCKDHLLRGEIDLYPEYTGTLLAVLLNQNPTNNRNIKNHSNEYLNGLLKSNTQGFQKIIWKTDFGFHNGYTLVMNKDRVIELGLDLKELTISNLAKIGNDLTICGDPESLTRPDCLGGIKNTYDINFKEMLEDRRHDALYQRLLPKELRRDYKLERQVDIIVGFTTDTQLLDSTFVQVKDDKNFFIKYFAGILVRKDIIKKFNLNDITKVFQSLEKCFQNDDEINHLSADIRMRKLIQEVESITDNNGEKLITMENLKEDRNPKAGKELRRIVREWLKKREII